MPIAVVGGYFNISLTYPIVVVSARQHLNLFIGISNKQFIIIYQCVVLTRVVLCTDLKRCCHSNLTDPCKVGQCIWKCESIFEVLPPLSSTLLASKLLSVAKIGPCW